jgi:uncharacterized membrane protein YgcG
MYSGWRAWLRVESFRRFLAASEAHHAKEAAEQGVQREYTAWAVALGELDGWTRAVTASMAAPVIVSYATSVPWLSASTWASTVEPSQSSGGGSSGWSGGSRGGEVGGGSGGGGSW